jgi:hypothetical protein
VVILQHQVVDGSAFRSLRVKKFRGSGLRVEAITHLRGREINGGADATARISELLPGERRKSDRAGRGWFTAQMRDRLQSTIHTSSARVRVREEPCLPEHVVVRGVGRINP